MMWGLFSVSFLSAGSAELNDKIFLRDALRDAEKNFTNITPRFGVSESFDVYRTLDMDLNGDGTMELVVAGTITDKDLNYVMAYYEDRGVWKHEVLNRGSGGGIVDFKAVDIDYDGKFEVYSILQDRDLKQSCRVFEFWAESETHFLELFRFDSKGGMSNSCNILLTQSGENSTYRIRIDEVEYPEDDLGDVKQKTYFYKLELQNFVLERFVSGRN